MIYYNPTSYLDAVRAGLDFCQKVNEKTGIHAAATVLTDAGMLKTTLTGRRDIIACFYVNLNTASDWVEFEFGYTANADGSGTFTAITPLFRVETGASGVGATPSITEFPISLIVKDTDGGAWTIRAQTNDAAASVTFAVSGFREAY